MLHLTEAYVHLRLPPDVRARLEAHTNPWGHHYALITLVLVAAITVLLSAIAWYQWRREQVTKPGTGRVTRRMRLQTATMNIGLLVGAYAAVRWWGFDRESLGPLFQMTAFCLWSAIICYECIIRGEGSFQNRAEWKIHPAWGKAGVKYAYFTYLMTAFYTVLVCMEILSSPAG
jgi:hypothetical protein